MSAPDLRLLAPGNARLAERRPRAERAGDRAKLDDTEAEILGGSLFDR